MIITAVIPKKFQIEETKTTLTTTITIITAQEIQIERQETHHHHHRHIRSPLSLPPSLPLSPSSRDGQIYSVQIPRQHMKPQG